MAGRFLAPTSTCVLTATGCANQVGYVWVGIVAPDDASASACFAYGASGDGGTFWSCAACLCMSTPMYGPFDTSGSAVHCTLSGANASALVAGM